MEKFGCVTPFGYNKTNICTNSTLAKKAHDYFDHTFKSYSDNCLKPCTYFLIDAIKIDEYNRTDKETAYLQLSFQEYVKVTTAFYNYLTLSMIAEIGGYVGLFLGVSFYQVTDVLNALINRVK